MTATGRENQFEGIGSRPPTLIAYDWRLTDLLLPDITHQANGRSGLNAEVNNGPAEVTWQV